MKRKDKNKNNNKPLNSLDSIEDVIQSKIADKAKKYGLSARTIKHFKTLEKYYKIDLEKRVITIPLHFTKASDIIDVGVGNEERPIIKRSLLSKISSIAHAIPYEFKIDVDLKIDNYEGYEHSIIASSLLDAFEIYHYDLTRSKINSNLKMIVLIVLGVILFAWLFYLCSKHWFGQQGDPVHDTIHEIVNCVASVFIWEAVYIAFLYDNSYDGISGYLLKRIHNINLYDAKKTLLYQITNKDMKETWAVDNRIQDVARRILFLAATAILCIAGCKGIDVIEIFIKYKDSSLAISSAVITLIVIIFSIFGGLGAISYYRDKGPFRKFLLGFAIMDIMLCLSEVAISVAILINEHGSRIGIKSIVLSAICLIFAIMFLVSIIILRKKDKEKQNFVIESANSNQSETLTK